MNLATAFWLVFVAPGVHPPQVVYFPTLQACIDTARIYEPWNRKWWPAEEQPRRWIFAGGEPTPRTVGDCAPVSAPITLQSMLDDLNDSVGVQSVLTTINETIDGNPLLREDQPDGTLVCRGSEK